MIQRYKINYYGGSDNKSIDIPNMIDNFQIPQNIVSSDLLYKAKNEAKNKFFSDIISVDSIKKITDKNQMTNTIIKYTTYTIKVSASTAGTVGSFGAGGDTVVDGTSLILQYLDFSKLIANIISETAGGISWLKTIWDHCITKDAFINGPDNIKEYVTKSFYLEKQKNHPNFIVGLCSVINKILTKISSFFGDILSFTVPDDGGVISVVIQEMIQLIKTYSNPYNVIHNVYNLMPNIMIETIQNYDKLVTLFNSLLDYLISLVTGLYYVNDTVFDVAFNPFGTAGNIISSAFGLVEKSILHPIETAKTVGEKIVSTTESIKKATDIVTSKASEEYNKFKESSPLAKTGVVATVGIGFALSPFLLSSMPFLLAQGFASSQYLITAGKVFGVNRDSCIEYLNNDLRKKIPDLAQLMQGTLGFVFALLTIITECK